MDNKMTHIKDYNQMPLILNLIHDCWFDVSDISYHSEQSLLTVKFERELIDNEVKGAFFNRVRIVTVECFLHFYHVKKITLNDTEKIGRYDLTGIEYQVATKRIFIRTGVPIDIVLDVEQFEVAVDETDKVVKTRTGTP